MDKMNTFNTFTDEFKKDIQRQFFVERANKAYSNKSSCDVRNLPMPIFQSRTTSTICFRERNRKHPDEGLKQYNNYSATLESAVAINSAREAHLKDKIRKIEELLCTTEAKIRESQVSKQLLKIKLKILQGKLKGKFAHTESAQDGEGDIFQLNQLTAYAKENLKRLKQIKELQHKEKCIIESYNKLEELLSSGPSLSFISLNN